MSKALKDLRDTYKRRDLLLPQIERHVVRKAQEPSTRREDVLHPSEMAKASWCLRKDYYKITGKPADYASRAPSFRMENTFDYGHTAHRKYQRWLREIGVLYGLWECKDCSDQFFDLSPVACQRCGSVKVKYREIPVAGEMILGHGDGIVVLDDVYRWLEIKTVGPASLRFDAPDLFDRYQSEQMTPDELWFQIKRPFASHQRQSQIYMELAQLTYPDIVLEECIILYEWKPTQEVKEFLIQRNPDYVASIMNKAAVVVKAVQEDTPPERPEWADLEKKTCGNCEYRKSCWNVSPTSASDKPTPRVKRATSAQRRRVLRPGA